MMPARTRSCPRSPLLRRRRCRTGFAVADRGLGTRGRGLLWFSIRRGRFAHWCRTGMRVHEIGRPRLRPRVASSAALAAGSSAGCGDFVGRPRQSGVACDAAAIAERHTPCHSRGQHAVARPEAWAGACADADAVRLSAAVSDRRSGAVPAPVDGRRDAHAFRRACRTHGRLAEPRRYCPRPRRIAAPGPRPRPALRCRGATDTSEGI